MCQNIRLGAMKMNEKCISCMKEKLDKDTIGINKKLLGMENTKFYCMDCLAEYLNTTTEDLIEKIEEFKEDGCTLF